MGTLRIIAGELRGRRLRVPPGRRVRPTADRVRESLFNILGGRVRDARVLDPFAGSGALGLEALSRGAREVVFVESDRAVLAVLRQNVDRFDAGERCRVVAGSAESALRREDLGGPFDLVLVDPPYGDPPGPFLRKLLRTGRLAAGGLVVLERESSAPETDLPEGLSFSRQVTYGRTRLEFLRPA